MHLITERRGHVLWARLNRPERLNALSTTILDGLTEVADEARSNVDIRCLVITGSGRSFCSGADLKERGAMGVDGSGEVVTAEVVVVRCCERHGHRLCLGR